MSACEVAFTLMKCCLSSGCSLRSVAQREIDFVVVGILAAAECALDLLDLSDHFEELAFDVDFLAEWIGSAEEFVVGIGAEDDDRRAALVIDLAEPAAGLQIEIENIFRRGGVAFENRLLRLAVAVLDHVGSGAKLRLDVADTGGDGLHVRQVFHGLGIFEGEFFAGAQFFGGRPKVIGMWKAKMMFDPMLLIMLLTLSLSPRTIDEIPMTTATPMTMPSTVRPGAQLVAADGGQRHRDDFTEFASADHFSSKPFHPPRRRGAEKICFLSMFQTVMPRSDQASLRASLDTRRRKYRRWRRRIVPPETAQSLMTEGMPTAG